MENMAATLGTSIDLLYFVLASFGLTQILVYGRIFDWIRPSYYVFHCTMCMGLWAGLFLFAISKYVTLFNFDYTIWNAFVLSCISSGTSYVLSILFDDFGLNLNHNGDED